MNTIRKQLSEGVEALVTGAYNQDDYAITYGRTMIDEVLTKLDTRLDASEIAEGELRKVAADARRYVAGMERIKKEDMLFVAEEIDRILNEKQVARGTKAI